MKIVFFGTPEFAVPSLEILCKNNYQVKAVVTAPSKESGRGLLVKDPAVKTAAANLGLKVIQPLKLSDALFVNELKLINADLFIVVAFRMMPELVWKMPRLGTFNLHSSLLPQYRGAAPINRVIMNGETVTGVTTFFLKHEIDTGNIIFRKEVKIAEDETAGELHDRLKFTGADLLLQTVKAIESNSVSEISQLNFIKPGEILKTAPKIFTEDCKIDWNKNSDLIHNQVRGLSPFPGAFTRINSKDSGSLLLKIFRTAKSIVPAEAAGTIHLKDNRMFISCSDYLLEILELQLEGKKRNKASEFVRGFRTDKEWFVN
jgi:methionyl-tRNA formyltransferase